MWAIIRCFLAIHPVVSRDLCVVRNVVRSVVWSGVRSDVRSDVRSVVRNVVVVVVGNIVRDGRIRCGTIVGLRWRLWDQ